MNTCATERIGALRNNTYPRRCTVVLVEIFLARRLFVEEVLPLRLEVDGVYDHGFCASEKVAVHNCRDLAASDFANTGVDFLK